LRPLAESGSRSDLLLKLLAYSFFYGFVLVNWVDLFARGIPGYHLWLAITYFAPFVTVLFLRGLEDWELALSLGLFTSLMNDCLYYVAGRLLFGVHVDLLEWYRCQLLPVCDKPVCFDFLLLRVRPYPYLMPLSIYVRVITTYLLLYRWWRE
jgi:hypothetical protein